FKGTLDIGSDIIRYHGRQFINAEPNNINTTTVGPEIRLDMSPTDKLNLSFSTSFNFSKTKYSLQFARNAKYLTQEYSTEVDWQLPKGFFLATDFNYRINNQYETGFNTKTPLF